MIQDLYDKVVSGEEVRKNLIAIKSLIKEPENNRALRYLLGSDFGVFHELLISGDPKTRKNAALILGELGDEKLLEPLYKAYEKENTLFVRSSFLTAMGHYSYGKYLPLLKERMEILMALEPEAADEKHIREEITVLRNMIIKLDKPVLHKFTGYESTPEILLITNKNHRSLVENQAKSLQYEFINNGGSANKDSKISDFALGILIQYMQLGVILPLRTYHEILFPVHCRGRVEEDPLAAAAQIADSDFLHMILNMHEGMPPFYFRIELRSRMPMDRRSDFNKKLAAELEKLTKRQLVNSTSGYEVELRLIEMRGGGFYPCMKLFTLKDHRFTYRKNHIPTSIHPVNAALAVSLAKDYMKENAQVLDPFCGTGTLLIERNLAVPAKPVYGIDLFGDAIDKARENTKLAKMTVNYINRDFFTFTHDYLFDELITNMPVMGRHKPYHETDELYGSFFDKIPQILKAGGIIILYSCEKALVKKYIRLHKELKLLREYLFDSKEETYLFIIQNAGFSGNQY